MTDVWKGLILIFLLKKMVRFTRFKHKSENMINVKSKHCNHEGCVKRPNFNLPTEKDGKYCFKHKSDGMTHAC